MNRKTLIILALLVVALVCGWYFTQRAEQPAPQAQAELWLPGLQREQISALEIQRAELPLIRLERHEQGWVLPAKASYPADAGVVAKLLQALTEARKVEARTADPALYARLGLSEQGPTGEQAVRLKVEQGQQPELKLLIGNPSQQDGQLVRRADEVQSWAVSQRIILPQTELEWLDRRVTQLPFAQVHELQVRHAGGETLTLYRDNAETVNFQIRELAQGQKLAFDGAADGMVRLFADLQFADAAPLAQVPFGGKPSLTFQLQTFEAQTLSGRLYEKGEQHWLLLDADSQLPANELLGRSDWAYRLEPFQYQSLAKKLADLLPAK